MAIPTDINYPTTLDGNSTLFGDPYNVFQLTLTSDYPLGTETTLAVSNTGGELTALNVPSFFASPNTGEIIYVETKNVPGLTITVVRSTEQALTSGWKLNQILTAQYITQIKKALIALETKVGIDEDTDNTTVDYFIYNHDHSNTGMMGANIPSTSITGNIDATTLDSLDSEYFKEAFIQELPVMASIAPLTGTAAALEMIESSGGAVNGFKTVIPQLLFPDAAITGRIWIFKAKETPRTGSLYLKIGVRSTVANGNLNFYCNLSCVSGGTTSMSANQFDSSNGGAAAAPTAIDKQGEISVEITNKDSIAKGDWVCLLLWRDGTSDTNNGVAKITSVSLEYV